MSGNNVTDLRAHLFATIEALRDKSNPLDIERAKAISEVATTIINTAKVEVDYIRATGSTGTLPFLEHKPDEDEAGQSGSTQEKPGILGRTVHRIKG